MASAAQLSTRTQSVAQLTDHDEPNAPLKARSKSVVAAAHVLSNKDALKNMTQHHQEECQRKLYDRCAAGDAILSVARL